MEHRFCRTPEEKDPSAAPHQKGAVRVQKMNPIHEKGGGIPPTILSASLPSLLFPTGETAGTPTKDENTPAYDAGYKKQLANKTEFLHFLNKYVKAPWAALLRPEDIELCDKEFFLEDCRKREADLVYRIHFRERGATETYPDSPGETVIYCYLIMELQSSVDFTMPLRFLTYVFALLLRIFLDEDPKVRERKDYRLPTVVPILFYNGKRPWSAVSRFADYQKGGEWFGGHLVDFEYYLVDLSRISEEYILNTNHLIDHILALDKNKNDSSQLLRILDVLEERIMQLPEDNQISLWDWMEHVLMAICNDKTKDQIQHLFKKKGARNEMIHGLQELILNERREGYLEGICQGISQGGIQTLIQDNIEIGISKTTILEKLQRRFSISPEEAEENYRRFSTGS